MPRRPRFDRPGCLHHVMNRGLARRTIFESRADVRYFLSRLAQARRRGVLEIHAFSLMSTHFHLLVRSVDGALSETMRRALNGYVRYFNRTRRRDGPLMRGRFQSIPIESRIYLRTLIRYIDQNAVDAGLVAHPSDYPYGSAKWLRLDEQKPRWLDRGCVDGLVARAAQGQGSRTATYDRMFAPRLSDRQKAWIEARLAGKARRFDELDRLLGNAEAVADWAHRKARLADGTEPGVPVLDPETAIDAIHSAGGLLANVVARPRSGRMRPAGDLMATALLRDAAGESFVSIARRLEVSSSTPQKYYRLHGECLEDAEYEAAYASILTNALRSLHRT